MNALAVGYVNAHLQESFRTPLSAGCMSIDLR